MTIEIAEAVAGDRLAIDFMDDLARKNGHCVGFLPRVAYDQAVQKQRVKVLFVNNAPAGYVIHGPFKTTTKIYQLVIAEDLRRIEYGTALVDAVRKGANGAQAEELSLHCASDLEANTFWQALGFELAGERWKDKSRRRWQNRYSQILPGLALRLLRQKAIVDQKRLGNLARLLKGNNITLGSLLDKPHNQPARRP